MTLSQARSISRRESTRSIRGRIPNSLEMARDSSRSDMALPVSVVAVGQSELSAMATAATEKQGHCMGLS